MTSRRQFLHASLAGSSLLLAGPALGWLGPFAPSASVAHSSNLRLHGAVFETAWAESAAFGAAAAGKGLTTFAIGDDVTPVWRHVNDLWRKRPVAISGLTTLTPLVLLEQSARDHGLRVASRERHPTAGGSRAALYSWVLAPRPTLHGASA